MSTVHNDVRDGEMRILKGLILSLFVGEIAFADLGYAPGGSFSDANTGIDAFLSNSTIVGGDPGAAFLRQHPASRVSFCSQRR
jgi:hypothetical protein